MKFTTITLGCKVNIYETEALIDYLCDKGWEYDKNGTNVDICIINTCTVTATSDQKSRQMIRQARRNNPDAIIVAMGCFVQTHVAEAMEIADIILGTKDRLRVYDLVNSYLETKQQINNVTLIENYTEYDEMKLDRLMTHTRGFVKIQDGCENFCSYCLIPFARGKIKSRNADNVINEIKQLVKLDTKEIILSGINTGTYGQDTKTINLAKLIERIMIETDIWRLRLSSIELMEISDELLDVIEKYKNRIAMHLHIPLQGGSDDVLIRMHRKYLTSDYERVINKIRSKFPNMAITTDCLAGFVGETEENFSETISFIKKIGFAEMHVFPYSRRKGTLADKMEGHLSPQLIKERAKKIIEVGQKMKIEYEKKFIGQDFDVLIEQKKGNYWVGHTSNYLEVYLLAKDSNLGNKIVHCTIDEIKNGLLYVSLKGEKNDI